VFANQQNHTYRKKRGLEGGKGSPWKAQSDPVMGNRSWGGWFTSPLPGAWLYYCNRIPGSQRRQKRRRKKEETDPKGRSVAPGKGQKSTIILEAGNSPSEKAGGSEILTLERDFGDLVRNRLKKT